MALAAEKARLSENDSGKNVGILWLAQKVGLPLNIAQQGERLQLNVPVGTVPKAALELP